MFINNNKVLTSQPHNLYTYTIFSYFENCLYLCRQITLDAKHNDYYT